jgi:hypothetical protein
MKKDSLITKMEYSPHFFEHSVFENNRQKEKIKNTSKSVLHFDRHLKQNNLERIQTT